MLLTVMEAGGVASLLGVQAAPQKRPVGVLRGGAVSDTNLAYNRSTGLNCHNPEISARAEMTAILEQAIRGQHVFTQRMSPITLSSQRAWR
jgi:hypothetical protein